MFGATMGKALEKGVSERYGSWGGSPPPENITQVDLDPTPDPNPHPHVLWVMRSHMPRCINHQDSACEKYLVGSKLKVIWGLVGGWLGSSQRFSSGLVQGQLTVSCGFHPGMVPRTTKLGQRNVRNAFSTLGLE